MMKNIKDSILPIFLAALWISISEFLRNELLLKSYWIEHYQEMGLIFPAEPVNGAIWGLWSLLFSILIYILLKRFSLIQTIITAWLAGFLLMWIVTGNLGVLPFKILYAAIPLSLFEIFLAALIIRRLSN